MNLRKEILKEHTRPHALKIAAYASASPARFKELMQCFLANEYRLAQRVAWSVSHAVAKKTELIAPYIQDLVAQLLRKDVHDAVIRNSLRILQQVEIPEQFHGDVINACFNFIEAPAIPAAFKAFSLTILGNLSKHYPELKNELKIIVEERWDLETAAFRSRGKKIVGIKPIR